MLNVMDCIITNLFEKLLYDIKSIQLIFLSFFVFFNLCKMKDRIWNLHNKVYISILKWNIILHSPNNIKRFFLLLSIFRERLHRVFNILQVVINNTLLAHFLN